MKMNCKILIFLAIFSMSISAFAEKIIVTPEEDNNNMFRTEFFKRISNAQILNYLIRKEVAENTSDIILGAKYLNNLLPPYDRKIDPTIEDSWNSLSIADKNLARINWFKKNNNSISIIELQKYINISKQINLVKNIIVQYNKRNKLIQIFDKNDSIKKINSRRKRLLKKLYGKSRVSSIKYSTKPKRKRRKRKVNRRKKVNKKTVKKEPVQSLVLPVKDNDYLNANVRTLKNSKPKPSIKINKPKKIKNNSYSNRLRLELEKIKQLNIGE